MTMYKSYPQRRVMVLDSYMTYLDTRAGAETVVLLHGNPAYSYTWRHVIPQLQGAARCIVPDLIGFGNSGHPEGATYRFQEQFRYFDAWTQAIQLPKKFVLVGHDWGAAVALLWASRNPNRVRGFIHIEGVVGAFGGWDDIGPKQLTEFYRKVRSDKHQENLVLDNNEILEKALATMTIERKLSNEELEEYRRPFYKMAESRKPTLALAKDLPVTSEGPDDVVALLAEADTWARQNSDFTPKLLVAADPGLFTAWNLQATAGWSNQKVAKVSGKHFPQEESPETIGMQILAFVKHI